MKWLLDTNVVSEPVRPRPNQNVVRWLARQAREDLAISVVALAELQHGVLLMMGDEKRAELTRWIDDVALRQFAGRILPVTLDVLIAWLELMRVLSRRRQHRLIF